MDSIVVVIVAIVGSCIAGTLLASYVSRGYNAFASLIRGDDEGFYGVTMPWPSGVQEEDEVHWHIPAPVASQDPAHVSTATRPITDRVTSPPTRPQTRAWRSRS